jgi:UDP-N-acetyl-D-mannosaminuronic acid dehydrogenase
MPSFTVRKLAEDLDAAGKSLADSTVVVLGLTYRAGVDETRASPGVAIASALADRAETVFAADPVCSSPPPDGVQRVAVDGVPDLDLDTAVLATAHEEFTSLPDDAFEDVTVVDGHRALEADDAARSVYAIGDGSN